ncbi:kojibiose phosphorylase [Paenibacillus albidus]|uniref:Kojibiose phosphorylase n=1 Tax=Paenibacillus albidus TaxID=2041023 RepID=A0A917CUV2_9BACL|nr:glycoside hydrolase family 65 protein [Paenibacillus albidus]GGF99693.1 kojibiose phosphorylase [Paenibacillus albidus]
MADRRLAFVSYAFTTSADGIATVDTGIDGDVWDINGPHLCKAVACEEATGVTAVHAVTGELGVRVSVAASVVWDGEPRDGKTIIASDRMAERLFDVACKAGETYRFVKCVAVCHDTHNQADPGPAAVALCMQASAEGWKTQLRTHREVWNRLWESADVEIEGDDEAQLALRYSIYQLLIIAPYDSDLLSIPARGLSGQTYKGAVFWDTEMFMLPFYLHVLPEVARRVMKYRVMTLEGARRKAAEYGYQGAFYAWESQDTGDDACTLFNVTDVFTNRPMRTYFRDKQIHISADVAFGIWQYYAFTGDTNFLLEGGAEAMLECARYYASYALYREGRDRYELLDVTGPDEYHERVHNNAFTNAMAKRTIELSLKALREIGRVDAEARQTLIDKLGLAEELSRLEQVAEKLYVPYPDPGTALIEQFDGYYNLEDVPLGELKSRMLNKHEYLGGGNGLATTTQILKQADVVLLLHQFGDQYAEDIKQANWAYYEPRTEHGSSLSPCVYALVAASIGNQEWAYPYFMRTATIDLTGESKQYVGTLYIGGTHPAANGGAWMAAVQGFGGLRAADGIMRIQPALPARWSVLRYSLRLSGDSYRIEVNHSTVRVKAGEGNRSTAKFRVDGTDFSCAPGGELNVAYA